MYIFFPLPCAKEIFVELIEELDIKPLSRYLRGGCREGGVRKNMLNKGYAQDNFKMAFLHLYLLYVHLNCNFVLLLQSYHTLLKKLSW